MRHFIVALGLFWVGSVVPVQAEVVCSTALAEKMEREALERAGMVPRCSVAGTVVQPAGLLGKTYFFVFRQCEVENPYSSLKEIQSSGAVLYDMETCTVKQPTIFGLDFL